MEKLKEFGKVALVILAGIGAIFLTLWLNSQMASKQEKSEQQRIQDKAAELLDRRLPGYEEHNFKYTSTIYINGYGGNNFYPQDRVMKAVDIFKNNHPEWNCEWRLPERSDGNESLVIIFVDHEPKNKDSH